VRAPALAVGVFLALGLAGTRLRAAPSLWERARHPSARAEEQLLVALERTLDEEDLAGADFETAERLARAAVAMIELKKVRAPRDPRLSVMMARALVDARLGREAEAEALLEFGVAHLPLGPLLAEAWHELGVTRALRGDAAGARDAQSRALELVWDPDDRAMALSYRAASEVRLRDLAAAESDFRSAAEHARKPEKQALARFGLGLVLERAGDLPSAYAAFDQGFALRLPLVSYSPDEAAVLPGGLFTPAYERFYLAALLAMTRARSADNPSVRRLAYEQAVTDWDAYLLAAPEDEPWVPNAHRHRERCATELHRLSHGRAPHAPR
jgi:tetratricopeptide (TPR) repeat protein